MNHYAYTCLEINGEKITYIVPKNIVRTLYNVHGMILLI